MKKIAVLIYPYFSMQEISCLTDAMAVWFDRSIDVFASSGEIMRSEDGFQCVANKTLEEFDAGEYECLILPGIMNPLPALFDERLISFLRGLKGKELLIAGISSAPMLLAKAGLLDTVKFTSGIWEEIAVFLDFIPERNIVRRPVVRDGRIITAIGFAFREFAVEVIRALGIDECRNGLFNGVSRTYEEAELIHYMGEENFGEFQKEYAEYVNRGNSR